MDIPIDSHIRGIIEALLFISEKPVMLEQFKEVVDGVNAREIRECILLLKEEYDSRKSGMSIVEIAGGYQMLSNPDYALYVKKFYRTRHKDKLSKPSLETLAIIAYKHPVTRLDIELIRGVNSDGVVAHLLSKGLIKTMGRKDVPGRPYLYGITRQFLEYFGLKSLEDLPKLEDFSELQPREETEGLEENSESDQTQKDQQDNEPEKTPEQSLPNEEIKNESTSIAQKD